MANFYYSLRHALDPRSNTPETDAKLLEFCKKGKIDNVTFMLNVEELNASHLTGPETQVWLDAIKPVQAELAKIGVTTSLNPWTTIMHSDRGMTVNPEIGFDTMVDINGKKATMLACPADPKWRSYLADRYAQYATLHPKELWLEDDFRHYNHTPLKLACFCDRHMKIYEEKLGYEISRADFVKEFVKAGDPTPARRVYLETARQEMIDTAAQIEKAVHEVSPETNVALMSSFPDWHALEGRDWAKLFDTLAGPGHPRVNRPHLPAYNEIAPLKYSRAFEEYTRITAGYLGDDAVLIPELENYMYSGFVKSVKFTQFQIETAALVGARGILLNLFPMMGNGVNDTYGYAEMLAESKPFLNKITENRLLMSKTRGIQILVDQDSSFTMHTSAGVDPEELLPQEKNWASLLGTFGFSTTITPVTPKSAFKDQNLAISGQLLRNLANEQIKSLIKDNHVMLDGESIQVLIDRGLDNELLHITNSEWHPFRSNYQAFEQADGMEIEGVKNPRITMLQHTGNHLQLEYAADADVKVFTFAYNEFSEKLGNVMALIDHHIIVMPMDKDPKYGWESQYIGYKQGIYQAMLDESISVDYLVGMPNVKLSVNDDASTVWLSNFTLDDYPTIKWHPAQPVASEYATLIKKYDNTVIEKEVKLIKDGAFVIINEPINSLETMQLLLK